MSKYANTINSFCTKSEKYTNEIILENFGLLRRMYSNYLTTEIYEHWDWSWSYMIQPTFQESKFRIVVQFNNLPLTPGHLLAFKAILYKKNSQITKSSECICLKEHLWLTTNLNILEICSVDELDQFIYKDTLRIMVIVRHDWLIKKLHTDQQILSTTHSNEFLLDDKTHNCEKKFLEDIKSISDQIETSDITIRVHNQIYKCHRAILSSRSSYFQRLFHSDFNEKSQHEIDLSSFLSNENDFPILHSYLYKAETNLTLDNILQYIQLSDKFLLDDLYELCEQFLLNDMNINETNVWNILDIYNTIGRKISLNIQEKCFHILKTNRHLINEQCHDLLKRHPHLSVELILIDEGQKMSDDDDMGGNDDFDLDYENTDEEPDADLENQYYNSKALKEDDPLGAIDSFKKVLALEQKSGDKGDWGFKALKQMMKIYFKMENYDEMLACYKELLTYIKSAVTRNVSEKSINSILDYISTSKQMDLLQNFYETTLGALKETKNERLWFKTNLKLGKLYEEQQDYVKLQKILKELHKSCQTSEGTDDQRKGTQLLEVYALEIQMHTLQKNTKKLKQLYELSLHIKAAIPHPLIMGVIRECGGKMHLREQEYEKAHTDFFEAFKSYDESGSPRRTTCLKYLVLANMLMRSTINPFDSQEAKPYKTDPEIEAMTNLVGAYQNNDIKEFESILRTNRRSIMDDQFIREHIEILLRTIRTKVLVKLIKPYTKIRIEFIAKELNIPMDDVESLLISCILDQTITGKIDQVNHVLELDQQQNIQGLHRYAAISKVSTQLQSVQHAIIQRFN